MKKMHISLLFITLFSLPIMSISQTVIPLYDGPVPNSKPCDPVERSPLPGRVSNVTNPTLTAFFAPKTDSLQTAVIICPGGGYARLSINSEGMDVAKAFNAVGVTAFVLKYRLPTDSCMENKEIGPLQDAQRAIQILRQRAKEWNINSNKIGIMGFSAGGHLAGSLGVHYDPAVIANNDNINLRPDFMILAYPVTSMSDSLAHMGSRDNLIGKSPVADKKNYYSNELQVTAKTPPAFFVLAADDRTVKAANSIAFFEALQKNKVPSEIHIYQNGGHGFGLHNATTKDYWFDIAVHWMEANKFK